MAKRRNLKKEKQLRNRAYAEKYRKTKTPRRGPGRPKSYPSSQEAGSPAAGPMGASAAPQEPRPDRPRIGASITPIGGPAAGAAGATNATTVTSQSALPPA